jgi:hypothetical protein
MPCQLYIDVLKLRLHNTISNYALQVVQRCYDFLCPLDFTLMTVLGDCVHKSFLLMLSSLYLKLKYSSLFQNSL